MTQDILQHQEGGVLTLTFNRVERKNSINVAMYEVLATAFEQGAQDSATRVVATIAQLGFGLFAILLGWRVWTGLLPLVGGA